MNEQLSNVLHQNSLYFKNPITRRLILFILVDYEEKGWTLYKIWKQHPEIQCSRTTIARLVKKIKITGSGDRIAGSGRKRSVSTVENVKKVEKLIQLKRNSSGDLRLSLRQIALRLGVSRASVGRIVKRLLKS